MITFDTSKKIVEHMQLEGYDFSDFQNDCDYQPESWAEITELLDARQELHTYKGDWQYFSVKQTNKGSNHGEN